jgi:4'-phosphopantetheinyl transferase
LREADQMRESAMHQSMMRQSMNITDSGFQVEAPLSLPEDEAQLWRIDLEAVGGDESLWQRTLSSDELDRASRFHFPRDRQRFASSRSLLRILLAGYLATDPAKVNFSYSKNGKPSLGPAHEGSNVKFNISHSGGITLLAFTRGREIGVDVEQVRSDFDVQAIARRFFSPKEQRQLADLPAEKSVDAFFRCWTRKEAYIKAIGDGLSLPLNQFDVSLESGEANALLATRPDGSEPDGSEPDGSEAEDWLLREVPGWPGYIAALCVRGQDCKLNDWSGGRHSSNC